MRIRTQLTLALVGIAAASSAVMGVFAFMAARDIGVDIFLMHQLKQTEMLGTVAGSAYERGAQPVSVLQSYLQSLKQMPLVSYAYVVGQDGKILLHTDAAFVGQPADRWKVSEAAAQAFELASPVRVGGQDAGYARIGFLEGLTQKLTPTVTGKLLPRLGLFAAFGITFGVLLGIGLAFYISQPIEEVSRASKLLGEGELSVQVPVSASNEVGDLIRQFNEMAARLKVLDELKDEFISNVSHDLRNPMAAIQMSADYLLNSDPERDKLIPKHRAAIENMSSSATKLGVFVTNILDKAKMKAGKMEYTIEPVPVDKLVHEMEALYGVVARHRKIAFVVDFRAGIPSAMADAQKLEHVVSNLLSNSLKYTPAQGTITLGAREAGANIEIYVADTGKGISKEALPRLFTRFEQDRATEPAAKGSQSTGLGLYIVKQTVEGMGGVLHFESEQGKGTRVTASFPAGPRLAAAAAPPTPAAQLAAARRTAKILVVDEDKTFADMTKLLLESLGHQAVVVGDAATAALTASSERPDLILMDMDFQEMPRADAMRQLKTNPATAAIPVILCSAVKDLSEIVRASESGAEIGAAFFLRKPLNQRELDLRIKQVLAGS